MAATSRVCDSGENTPISEAPYTYCNYFHFVKTCKRAYRSSFERLFSRTGMGWDDIDLVELNEAFAPAVLTGWGRDERDRLNVTGSGISLGHPIGATGGRILANLPRELKRRDGTCDLETMFIGGGHGPRRPAGRRSLANGWRVGRNAPV
jgi:hypothetical protein